MLLLPNIIFPDIIIAALTTDNLALKFYCEYTQPERYWLNVIEEEVIIYDLILLLIIFMLLSLVACVLLHCTVFMQKRMLCESKQKEEMECKNVKKADSKSKSKLKGEME
jgi:predicted membrane protein